MNKFNSTRKNSRSYPSGVYSKNAVLTFDNIQYFSIVKIYNKIGIHRYLLNMVSNVFNSAPNSVFSVYLMGRQSVRRSVGCPQSPHFSIAVGVLAKAVDKRKQLQAQGLNSK